MNHPDTPVTYADACRTLFRAGPGGFCADCGHFVGRHHDGTSEQPPGCAFCTCEGMTWQGHRVRMIDVLAAGTALQSTNRFADATDLEAVIAQAVGAASMCWQHPERAGEYDTREAFKVAADAVARIRELLADEAT